MRCVVQALCWCASRPRVLALQRERHTSSAAHAGEPGVPSSLARPAVRFPHSGSSGPRLEVGWWALIAGGLPPHGSSGWRGVPVQASAGVARGRERARGVVQERCWPVGPGGGPEGPPEDRTGLKRARLRAPGKGGRPHVDCDSTPVRGGLKSEFEILKSLLKSVLNIGVVD